MKPKIVAHCNDPHCRCEGTAYAIELAGRRIAYKSKAAAESALAALDEMPEAVVEAMFLRIDVPRRRFIA